MFTRLLILSISSLLTNAFPAIAQPCASDYPIISTKEQLLKTIKADSNYSMISLKKLIPTLILDFRYATPNNFTKTVLYKDPVPCLRRAPAHALRQIQEELRAKGLSLKLYDAYRPFSITCKMWRLVPDRRYAANPRKGSNHNRGVAVDITLVDTRTGKELEMGTPYDNFTDTAHHNFYLLPPNVIANRRLLKTTLRKYGFDIVPDEWWHYQWRNRNGYDLLDLDFDVIKNILE